MSAIVVFLTMLGADLLSKHLMYVFFPDMVVFNLEISKLGLDHTNHIASNIMMMGMLVSLGTLEVVRAARSWIACVMAGSVGNLTSYLFGPAGVADFIPIGSYALANFADFAIWVGVVGMISAVTRQAYRVA